MNDKLYEPQKIFVQKGALEFLERHLQLKYDNQNLANDVLQGLCMTLNVNGDNCFKSKLVDGYNLHHDQIITNFENEIKLELVLPDENNLMFVEVKTEKGKVVIPVLRL